MLIDKLLRVDAKTVIIYFVHKPPLRIYSDTGRALELAWLILGLNPENLEKTSVTFSISKAAA